MPASAFPVSCRGKNTKDRRATAKRLRRLRRQLAFEALEARRVLASISGQLVYDFDGNGALDAYEAGLPGWQIYIDSNNNEQLDVDEPTERTDANGEYTFDDLASGFYTLRLVQQNGWQQTFPSGVGKHTVSIRNVTQEVVGINFAEQRLFTPLEPDHLLVTRSSFVDNDLLLEYTRTGELVQALVIPGTDGSSRLIAKDLVLDSRGNLQIFNGYDDVRLTTFNGVTAMFSDTLVPAWDMGQTFDQWGDMAAFGNFVFANEQVADGGTANGVIRFDARDLSYQRFSDGFGVPTDLTVGLDGLLYTLNATVNNTTVLAHNPETMALVRAVNIAQRLQSLAVDAAGDVYAVTDTGLKHYRSDGTPVPVTTVVNGLDIDISHDNKLVVTSDVRVTLLDATLLDAANGNDAILASFPIVGSVAENFLAFAAFVQDPVGASQGGGEIDYGVLEPGNILVSNSASAYPASQFQLKRGALSDGSLESLSADDDNYLTIREMVGAPGSDVEFLFQDNMPDPFLALRVEGYYEATAGRGVKIQLWNYRTSQWDNLTAEASDIPAAAAEQSYRWALPTRSDQGQVTSDYRSGSGQWRVKIFQPLLGDLTTRLNLDGIFLEGKAKLLEYTSFGELVAARDLPVAESGGARDLVTDALGNVQIFNGTFAPRLTTFDSHADGFVPEEVRFDGWSTDDLPSGGGLASYRNYVYATDAKTQSDTRAERGIVRYNLASPTEPFERFHSQLGGVVDLNVGLDGLLYSLGPARQWTGETSNATFSGTTIVSGDLGSLSEDDEDELTLAPRWAFSGLDVRTVFDGVPNLPLTAVVRGWYEGLPDHNLVLQIWNVRTNRWQNVTGALQDFPAATGEQTYVFALPGDLTDFIAGGNFGTLQLRITDPMAGDTAQRLHLDQLILQGGTVVRQYNPVTMELLKTLTLPGSHRAIAVDANGDIFAAGREIVRYTNDGVPLGVPLEIGSIGELCDVDLDADGRLLAAASDGHIVMSDRKFTGLFTFLTRPSGGMNFAAFVSPDRPLPKARWDSFTLHQPSSNNILDVLANDGGSSPKVLTISGTTTPTAGGTVSVAGNTQLDYSPAQNPDFVGQETFTYTIDDGLGGTDRAAVQVTVEGNGNYFVFDDRYGTTEDALVSLSVPAAFGLLANDGRPDIFPVLTPGNILVSHSPTGSNGVSLLQEYTRSGDLVRTVELPSFTGATADVRDLVVDRNGNIQIYNGTAQPRLTTYDPVADTLAQTSFPNWNTTGEKIGGGLAAWRNFVYATDQVLSGENASTDAGIVRFDIEAGTAQRFVADGNYIDLTVGPDGLLYALGPGGATSSRFIRAYDPETMVQRVQIAGLPADLCAIAIDTNGEILGVRNSANVTNNPYVYRYNRSGVQLQRYPVAMPNTEADFSDIDLSEDGRTLLIANVNQSNSTAAGDGDIVLFDLGSSRTTILQAPDESSDMKFAAWVRAPAATVNGPLTVRSHTQPSHGILDCNLLDATLDGVSSDGSFCYVPDPDFSGTDRFFYVVRDADGRLRGGSVTLTVAPQNDPPQLRAAAPRRESDEDTPLTLPLTEIINGGAGTTTITELDVYDPLGAIAVTALTGPGVWSFSLDGINFVDIGRVSMLDALLLPNSADIRFTPFGGSGGTATFSYAAWDQTLGTAGNRTAVTYSICTAGGIPDPDTGLCTDGNPPEDLAYDAFSQDADQRPVTDTLTITLTDFNDAPVVVPTNPQMGTTDEHTPLTVAVGSFVTGVTDPDGLSNLQGIVVVSAAGLGLWEYSVGDGVYSPLSPVSASQALVLEPNSLLRYTPDDLNGEVATVTYRAKDKTVVAEKGYRVDASQFGGSTAFSAATDTGWIEVTDINDAPVLEPQWPQIGTTDVVTPFQTTLDQFVRGITDVDHNAVIGGIAITSASGQGTWSYSLNGTIFVNFPALSTGSALLLRRGDTVRYTPAGGAPETALLAYQAWDTTQGAPGGTANASLSGGDTAFSVASDLASLSVLEVNDPPVIGGVVSPVAYTENAPPAPILANGTVVDPDSVNFAGGQLEARIISGGTSGDRLLIREGNGISLAGDTVIYDSGGLRLIGSYSVTGWVLTVRFTTPDATQAAVQALLRSLAYESVSDNPTAAERRIQVSITDGDGGNDTGAATQTVTVLPVNDPPVAQDDAYETFANQTLVVSRAGGVLANDVDPEGTALTAALVATTLHGDLTFHGDGSFTYLPDELFYGLDVFSYRVSDGQLFSYVVRAEIDVRLRPTNPAQPADVNADGFLSPLDAVLIANYLLQNGSGTLPAQYDPPPFVDRDADGSATQTDVAQTAADIDNGGARPVPPPALVIQQTPPWPGPDKLARVTLQATDAAGTPLASVNVGQAFYLEAWVSDQRATPLGVAAAYLDVTYPSALVSVSGSLSAGAEFPHFAAGQTSTDGLIDEAGAGRTTTLPDGQEHRLWRVAMLAKARGAAVFAGDPADVFPAGQFLLFGIAGPLDGLTNVEYVAATLQIKGPPVAVNDSYGVDEDTKLTVTVDEGVLANDLDEEGDVLTALVLAPPSHGTLQFSANGSFTYEPAQDFSGTDRFTYRANDGVFDSNTATVTVTVTGLNDAPVAAGESYSVLRNGTLHVTTTNGLLANDGDADGDPLTVQLVQSPAHGVLTVRADGSFDYAPTTDYGGTDRFTYKASDGIAESAEVAVDLAVLYPWQNPYHPVDINGDGYASPLDALLSFNDYARHGVRALPNPPVPPDVPPPFLDFNDDSLSSDFDGKKVLTDLNANGSRLLPAPRTELPQTDPPLGSGPLVRLRLEAVNAQGQVVSAVNQGETFFLNVYAADLRAGGTGVFSAYLDVAYDPDALVAGAIQFGTSFPNVHAGSTSTPGLLDEAGAVRTAVPDGISQPLLLKLALTAVAAGDVAIQANAADVMPAGQVTLYGIDGPIPADKIEYGTTSVTVVPVDSDGDGMTDYEEDGAPNGGDGNRDGTPDRLQSNVASFRLSQNDPYTTIAAPPQVTLTNVSAVANPAPGTAPADVQFPLGFFRFDARGVAAGGATTVTVYAQAGTALNTFYGYGSTPDNATPHWYPFPFHGATGAAVFADRIELHLADGQLGDGDPVASRITFGPGGPGLTPTPWTNPRDRLDVNNDGARTAGDALTLINAINVTGPQTLPLLPPAGVVLPPFRDTNWDNLMEAADVLNIVNFLNSQAAGEGEWEGTHESAWEAGTLRAAVWPMLENAASPQPSLPAPTVSRINQHLPANRLEQDAVLQTRDAAQARHGLPAAPGARLAKQSLLLSAEALDFARTVDEIASDVALNWGPT